MEARQDLMEIMEVFANYDRSICSLTYNVVFKVLEKLNKYGLNISTIINKIK